MHQIQILQAVKNPERCQQIQFKEFKYRWIVVLLMGSALLLNGVANNAVIPLQHKMTLIYGVSETEVSVSVILTFLVFSLFNFPANHIIDTHGLRVSFLLGTSLYALGVFFYAMINYSFYFVIVGTVFLGMGQPFLLNCPAKVASMWFFPKNRALATAIMIGTNLFGMGIGFLIPALMVKQQSTGQQAKAQIYSLYSDYFLAALLCFILNFIFMKEKPHIAPSQAAFAQKLTSPREAIQFVKKDRNLWKFFIAYFLSYGTFIAFASNCNFIIKPYDYTDIEIASNALMLMVFGAVGAICFSFYIKKTFNYSTAIKVIAVGSTLLLIFLCVWLNTTNGKILTTVIISMMGFIVTPLIPLCYDLGCELSFPLGEAQVTGLLNGGAMIWAFIASTFVSTIFGYGTKGSSLTTMGALSMFILGGSILFFCIHMNLKRQSFEQAAKVESQQRDMKVQMRIESEQNKCQSNRYIENVKVNKQVEGPFIGTPSVEMLVEQQMEGRQDNDS